LCSFSRAVPSRIVIVQLRMAPASPARTMSTCSIRSSRVSRLARAKRVRVDPQAVDEALVGHEHVAVVEGPAAADRVARKGG